jgi:hypothetical protein
VESGKEKGLISHLDKGKSRKLKSANTTFPTQ